MKLGMQASLWMATFFIFHSQNAKAQDGYYYPGATYSRHTRDRSYSFDHQRQCDENGCLYTDTTQQYYRSVDQHYVPHSNAPQNYYRPRTSTLPPGGWYDEGGGHRRRYYDDKGNIITIERYNQMKAEYADWANKYGTSQDRRKARSLH